MKKLLGCMLVLCFSLSLHAKRYKFAYIEYPPFIFSKDGKITGLLVPKVLAMFPNKHVDWVSVPLSRMTEAINSGLVDASVVYMKTPERAKLLDFTQNAIIRLRPHLCHTKKVKLSPKNLITTLNEKTTTVVPRGNHIATKKIRKMGAKTKLVQISYEGNYIQRSLKLVANERADFAFLPAVPLDHKILNRKDVSCVPVGAEIRIPFAVKKGNKKLLKELNDSIVEITAPVKR